MKEVKETIQRLNPLLNKEGLELKQVYDETIYINSSIDLVQQNIIIGGLLAALILLLFLNSIKGVLIKSKPFDLKVLKTDLAMYINSDDDIIELGAKINYLETTLKYIDGVIKSIDNRGWDIKNAIEWKKFEAGMI